MRDVTAAGLALRNIEQGREFLSYGQTYRSEIHSKIYGFPNIRVLTTTRGQARVQSLIEAYRAHASRLCSPAVFLFADRARLLNEGGALLDMKWVSGSDQSLTLLE